MWNLVASSGKVADCNQLNTARLTFPFSGKRESPSLKPVLGLSILSYCTNMAVQHGQPVPSVDIIGHSKVTKPPGLLVSGEYTLVKT